MKLSIIVITARAEPQIDKLLHALDAQGAPGDTIEIVVVDFYGRRPLELAGAWNPDQDRARQWTPTDLIVVRPKPTPYQGEHRVTRRDLHAIANARNTGYIVSSLASPFLAFLDDRVQIGSRWLATIRDRALAAERGDIMHAICGPCDRVVVGDRFIDDRRARSRNGRGDCPGDWLYGGNFALPATLYAIVNGCEEGTDPCGRQDRVLGMMLRNANARIDFSIGLEVTLDRTARDQIHPFPRVVPGVPPADKGRAILQRFGARARTDSETTPDLAQLRARYHAGDGFPMHAYAADSRDWFSHERLGDLP